MKVLNNDLKTKEFKPIYLLYGSETYLKRQFKQRFREAILPEDDSMNYAYYEGKAVSVPDIIDLCNTMPFFAKHRLVILENSGLFSSSGAELAEFVKNIPDSVILLMIENEVDKRSKLFKAIKDKGHIEELSSQDASMLKRWIASLLKQESKVISVDAVDYLITNVGVQMELLKNEIDKLISYTSDRNEVTKDDIDAVCIKQIQNHIFEMVEAVANKNQVRALQLYHDLLTLREPPMRILSLLTRQYRILLQVKDMSRMGIGKQEIAKQVGVPPYFINKYMDQSKKYQMFQIHNMLAFSAELEESIKIGNVKDQLAVELFIVGI